MSPNAPPPSSPQSSGVEGQGLWKATRWLLIWIACIWLGYQFWRLLFQFTPPGNVALSGAVGAVDLSLRHMEVNGWFAGERIYWTQGNAVYPPASYLVLWPFVGWLNFTASRVLFGVVTIGLVLLLVRLYVKAHEPVDRKQRALLVLLPLAIYPVGATIGNGQLGILVLVCLTLCLPRLTGVKASWLRDLGIAALFLVALIKPTLSVPFFWIVLFARGGLRPATLIGIGYVGLTALASLAQKNGPIQLMRAWFERGVHGAAWGARHGEGSIRAVTVASKTLPTEETTQASEPILRITSINLHSTLGYLGHANWITPATLIALGLVGLWVLLHRRRSIWILMAVVAIVARFYTYHGWYDDVLLLLPLIALARIAKDPVAHSKRISSIATFLLVSMTASLLAPGGSYLLPYPWNNIYLITQSALWLCVLMFLLIMARHPGVQPSASI
ncbi:MAG: DUF2029 domain-containing protein [bacterium]|nr:DUF2029 domain-containing protein [bacterium]